jgi:hypothetical protein
MAATLFSVTWGSTGQATDVSAEDTNGGFNISGTATSDGGAITDYFISDDFVRDAFNNFGGETATSQNSLTETLAQPSTMEEKVAATSSLTLDANGIALDGAAVLSKSAVTGLKVFTKTTGLIGAAVGTDQSIYNIYHSISNGESVKWNDIAGVALGLAAGIALATPLGEAVEGLSLVIDAVSLANDTYSASQLH